MQIRLCWIAEPDVDKVLHHTIASTTAALIVLTIIVIIL